MPKVRVVRPGMPPRLTKAELRRLARTKGKPREKKAMENDEAFVAALGLRLGQSCLSNVRAACGALEKPDEPEARRRLAELAAMALLGELVVLTAAAEEATLHEAIERIIERAARDLHEAVPL